MNGTDWPSPAALLFSVQSEIKEILDAAGVDFPSCSSGRFHQFLFFFFFMLIIKILNPNFFLNYDVF